MILPELLRNGADRQIVGTVHGVVIRKMVERWLLSQAPLTLRYNSELSQKARREAVEQVADVTIRYDVGDVLLPAGQPVDEESLSSSRRSTGARTAWPYDQRLAHVITVVLILILLAVINGFYIAHYEKLAANSGSNWPFIWAMVVAAGLGRILAVDYWGAGVVPMIATVMVFAIAYNQVLATLTAFTLSLDHSALDGADLSQFVVLMSVAAMAAIMPRTCAVSLDRH